MADLAGHRRIATHAATGIADNPGMSLHRSCLALVATLAFAAGAAEAPDDMPAEHALSAAGVAGAQIAARRAGNLAPAALQCILDLRPDVFVPMFHEQLTLALTPDELAATEAFYGGPLRDKILRDGVAAVYHARGLPPPGGDVVFTPAERAAMDRFETTSAGDKLYRQATLSKPEFARIREKTTLPLFQACRDKGEAGAAP
jgi:hypothetical protein